MNHLMEKREKINNSKLEKLLPDKQSYYANAIDKSTNNPFAPEVSDKLPLTRTGQLQKKIVFKEGAPVMITSNHPKRNTRIMVLLMVQGVILIVFKQVQRIQM